MHPIFYLILGVIPSLVWLAIYLKKDIHPEPKGLVLQVFILGMISSGPAIFIETGTINFFKNLVELGKISPTFFGLFLFLFIAATEEIIKFLVVKIRILKDSQFDEPIDAIVYMITAAMGFAAVENTLFFLSDRNELKPFVDTLELAGLRFFLATFLHAVCSGILGYFLARYCFKNKKKRFLALGLFLAIALHSLYNFSIMKIKGEYAIAILAVSLIILAFFLSRAFKKLSGKKGLCLIEKPLPKIIK